MLCCAVGCTNRSNKLIKTRKFYRIPATRTPFKANRRRFWLQDIRRSDWNEQIIKNALICSDHFISGAASDDFDSPDFVPSIFPYSTTRYMRKRKRDETPRRCPDNERQSTPSSLSPNDCEMEPGADLCTEAMVPKAVNDDLKPKYSQPHTECDNLRVDFNKLEAENEQFKSMPLGQDSAMFQLRSFIHQRLFAAAEEIHGEVERTIALAVCDPDSLLHITATLPSLTNSAAALAGEETSTQPSIKEEFTHDPSEPPGLSHTIIDTENSHGNQCSLHFSLEIKEEQEEQLVADGQIQEVVIPCLESVKEERDQLVMTCKSEKAKEKVQAGLPDSESFIHQRLFAAAEEILGEVERTITLAVCDGPDPDSLLHITATIPSVTNSTAALSGEGTQPSIKEEFNHDPSMPPGLSNTIINTENSHGNQCSPSFSLEIKEEPEEHLVDDGQTQEVVLPFPESVKEERDQLVMTSKSEKAKEKVQTGLPDSESFIHQRPFAAAEEILGEVERTITLAVCDGPEPDSLLHITATIPSVTNGTAALSGEETQPSIKEEFNNDPSEPPGFSHTITDTENSHGNQCSLGFSSEIKEEQEEEHEDDGQTQEVVLHSPESVKEERDQPVTPDDNEQWLFSSDFSAAESDDNGSDEEWVERKESQINTRRWTGKVPQSQCGKAKKKVQAALPDRESSARSQKDSRACPVCGRGFRYIHHFTKHMETHKRTSKSEKKLLSNLEGTQTENLVCKVCCKGFASRSSLWAHSKIHKGIKDFECQECGKTFRWKYDLMKHTRTHTGEKPYHCDICDKAFTQNSSLTTHTRIHTGERPYHCDICGKAFIRKAHLTGHRMKHTGEKPSHM